MRVCNQTLNNDDIIQEGQPIKIKEMLASNCSLMPATICRASQLSNFHTQSNHIIPVPTLLGAVRSPSAALPRVFGAPLLNCVQSISHVPMPGWCSSTVALAQICASLHRSSPQQDYAGTHASDIPTTAKQEYNQF